MELILGTLKELGLWAVILAILFSYWLFILGGLHEEGNTARARWIKFLKKLNWKRNHDRAILMRLRKMDLILSPEMFGVDRKLSRARNPLKAAFSFNLLNMTLALAFFYPLIAILVQSAVSSSAVSIGGNTIMPAEKFLFVRLLIVGGIVLQTCCSVLAIQEASDGKPTSRLIGLLCAAGAITTIFLILNSSVGFFIVALSAMFMVATVFAVLFAVVGAKYRAVAGGGVFGTATAFAVSMTFSGATVAADVGVPAFFAAFVFTFMASGALAFGQTLLGQYLLVPAKFLFCFALTALIAIGASIAFSPTVQPPIIGTGGAGMILFIGILPLLNGLLDFLSAGMTRLLIRWSRTRWWAWLLDLPFAIITLACLAAAFIAFVTFAVPQDNQPLLNLPQLFENVRLNPGEYWWLSFMLFSTLLPTFLHAVIALSGIHLLTRKSWRIWIANELNETRDLARARRAKLVLVTLNAFSYWIPTFVIIYVGLWIWTADHGLRDILVDGANWLYDIMLGWRTSMGLPPLKL